MLAARGDDAGDRGLVWVAPDGTTPIGAPPGRLQALAIDADGGVWAGTRLGLYRLDGGWSEKAANAEVRGFSPGVGLAYANRGGDTLVWALEGGRARAIQVVGPCAEVVALLDGPPARLVCRDAVYESIDGAFRPVADLGPASARPAPAPPEERVSDPWIAAASPAPEGGTLLAEHARGLLLVAPRGGGAAPVQRLDGGVYTRVDAGGGRSVAIDAAGVGHAREGGTLRSLPGAGDRVDAAEIDSHGTLWAVRASRRAPWLLERWPAPWAPADRTWSLADGSDLSPGVRVLLPDEAGGARLGTSRGLWHAR